MAVIVLYLMGGSRAGGGSGECLDPPLKKYQFAICSLRYTGMDPLEKQLDLPCPIASCESL